MKFVFTGGEVYKETLALRSGEESVRWLLSIKQVEPLELKEIFRGGRSFFFFLALSNLAFLQEMKYTKTEVKNRANTLATIPVISNVMSLPDLSLDEIEGERGASTVGDSEG